MKKHIESPKRFIHYCIHCAMDHEEKEMQEQMEYFLENERNKMIGIFHEQLDRYVNDDENKKYFINDILRGLK